MSETNDLIRKIDETLDTVSINDRSSYFQLKYFVIGKEPSLQGKMWACLRELKARKSTFESLTLETEEMKDNIKLANIERKKLINSEIDDEEKAIHIAKLDRKIDSAEKRLISLNNKIKGTMEEAKFFTEAFQQLSAHEELKPWDDLDVQKEYWNNKLMHEIHVRMLMGRPVDPEIINTALSLPDDSPVKMRITKMLKSQIDNKDD